MEKDENFHRKPQTQEKFLAAFRALSSPVIKSTNFSNAARKSSLHSSARISKLWKIIYLHVKLEKARFISSHNIQHFHICPILLTSWINPRFQENYNIWQWLINVWSHKLVPKQFDEHVLKNVILEYRLCRKCYTIWNWKYVFC